MFCKQLSFTDKTLGSWCTNKFTRQATNFGYTVNICWQQCQSRNYRLKTVSAALQHARGFYRACACVREGCADQVSTVRELLVHCLGSAAVLSPCAGRVLRSSVAYSWKTYNFVRIVCFSWLWSSVKSINHFSGSWMWSNEERQGVGWLDPVSDLCPAAFMHRSFRSSMLSLHLHMCLFNEIGHSRFPVQLRRCVTQSFSSFTVESYCGCSAFSKLKHFFMLTCQDCANEN